MPAFGTGAGEFPLYQCASIMLAETVRYLKDHPKTGLRRIIFSTYTDAAKAAFKNAMAGVSRASIGSPSGSTDGRASSPRLPRVRPSAPSSCPEPYPSSIKNGPAMVVTSTIPITAA